MFRSPVVAILGHVDHGKTSLLDYIRKTNLTEKEYGGITQKIGAYEIETQFKDYKTNKITFIDTPGHEAFSKLRSRGADVADIALLLIDGKDSVMPQTVESIYHIKNAKIPYVVVINKIDLPEADPEKVKTDLLKYEVLTEGKGGQIPVVLVSAKNGQGVKELLEMILFVASDLNLNCNLNSSSLLAYIIETKKDKRGVVASAIIKNGLLKTGDFVYVEDKKIKVRALYNDKNQLIKEVIPSMPFEILGFDDLPVVGSIITSQKMIISENTEEKKSTSSTPKKTFSLDDVLGKNNQKEKKLSLIIKTDNQGSLEAINDYIKNNKNIEIVLTGIGEINKSDVFLAKTTKSIIIGFNVKPASDVLILSEQEKIIIKTYKIIYELLEEINEVADLLKEKETKEKNLKGEAKILAQFNIENEIVYGVSVTKGKINLNDDLEIYNQKNNLIGKTKLVSLKIKAKTVNEVKKGQEAGMMFYPKLDISIGCVVKSIL